VRGLVLLDAVIRTAPFRRAYDPGVELCDFLGVVTGTGLVTPEHVLHRVARGHVCDLAVLGDVLVAQARRVVRRDVD
jgi:hypothetical protein